MNPTDLKKAIEDAVSNPGQISEFENAIRQTIQLLDTGKIRVAEKMGDEWITHAWIKNAILLYFKISPMSAFEVGPYSYYDKIPLKTNFKELNVRVVPPAVARIGTFMEAGVVLMPSYVNIGAYIGAGTMVDTWATVGSCGQIGKNVHLSGGVGIGGVLEPASATPVIVEDNAFIGSRAIIVEGVRVGHDSVIAANVTLTSSTPIIDVRTPEHKVLKGFVPPGSVVVPGTREKEISGGKIQLACAYIIGNRKESTDKKTSLNEVLREFALSV
jgi:2,3,4,5-tetrahydropyridine-2-carboxylate N-succinyltransferase